jgi:hypothetical protein
MDQIGILTGKFKPPHIGHYETILMIAEDNDATEVFVSPIEMEGITGEMAVKILEMYFEEFPDIHIHLAEGSPVKAAYIFVDELGKQNDSNQYEINIYALESDMQRFATIDKYIGRISKINRIKTTRPKGVSGTMSRTYKNTGDKESFFKSLPRQVDKEAIWNVLNETGEYAVPADSFDQSGDPNTSPSMISPALGGIPSQWTNSHPYSRWNQPSVTNTGMNEENPEDGEPQQPTGNKHILTFDEFNANK